jgi:hypothetical protein
MTDKFNNGPFLGLQTILKRDLRRNGRPLAWRPEKRYPVPNMQCRVYVDSAIILLLPQDFEGVQENSCTFGDRGNRSGWAATLPTQSVNETPAVVLMSTHERRRF